MHEKSLRLIDEKWENRCFAKSEGWGFYTFGSTGSMSAAFVACGQNHMFAHMPQISQL